MLSVFETNTPYEFLPLARHTRDVVARRALRTSPRRIDDGESNLKKKKSAFHRRRLDRQHSRIIHRRHFYDFLFFFCLTECSLPHLLLCLSLQLLRRRPRPSRVCRLRYRSRLRRLLLHPHHYPGTSSPPVIRFLPGQCSSVFSSGFFSSRFPPTRMS